MRLRAAIAVCCAIGVGIAGYLTVIHYAHVAPVCTTGGCEKVQHSKYAELAGAPVALLGLVAYVVILATALVRGVTAALAGAFVALVGVAFSGYLLWAQLGPIGAICQWCLGNDLTILVVAGLTIARMLTEPAE
ncbi:MAG TPA: vitamin K epoxide reductase family protein [Gaiellaceae bacterium]|nr:vitamin K epoxide reductase family protein [Gaiellaceae bacterium]